MKAFCPALSECGRCDNDLRANAAFSPVKDLVADVPGPRDSDRNTAAGGSLEAVARPGGALSQPAFRTRWQSLFEEPQR